MDVDKDAFIEHLKSRLQERLTIYYVIADQLNSENGKGCNVDVKESFYSLALSNPNDFNLTTFVQKQIENFEKSLKPIGSRPRRNLILHCPSSTLIRTRYLLPGGTRRTVSPIRGFPFLR